MNQQTLPEYLRHGQTPFFRLPGADAVGAPADLRGADAVLLGVPYDGGTTYLPGARLGPYALRRVSGTLGPHHPQRGLAPFGRLRCLDGGNIPAPPSGSTHMRELVQGVVGTLVGAGARPFVVGGDHSITLPILRAVAAARGPLALVHVDAHFDTSDERTWGEAYHHGTPIRHALQEGLVAPGTLFQIGLRGPWKDEHEPDLSRAHDARLFSMDDIDRRGIADICGEVLETIGPRPTYLTFDIDAVDPAFAPGTGTPVPGGLTSREALALVRGLAGVDLVGMDLVEVAPAYDHADVTALLASHLLFEGIALLACR
jgi:agmatinase